MFFLRDKKDDQKTPIATAVISAGCEWPEL